MDSAFTPDSRYDNSIIKLIGNVYCPNTMCLYLLCVQKKTFQFLSKSDYQRTQCNSLSQVRNVPFEEQTKSFLSKFDQGI